MSHCGPLRRAWRSAAFLQRVAESGPVQVSRLLEAASVPFAVSAAAVVA